ncbi:MAG: hypothetical protein GY936_15300 [Ignavibacteriae bacterium]|nr:hypothetical protein [Ignavibacteriota bacterium]
MNIKKIILSVLIFSATGLLAQSSSTYSRYGLGDLFYAHSAEKLGMGSLEISISKKNYLNSSNPATWFSLRNTHFAAGVSTTMSNISDDVNSVSLSSTRFSGFHVGFPFEKDLGITFALGLEPYSLVNYDVTADFEDYTSSYTGKGGLSKMYLGLSYKLPLDFAIGTTFEYYTGNTEYSSTILFDVGSDFSNSKFTTIYNYRGIGTTIGLLSPDLADKFSIKNLSDFRLGFTYNIIGALNTDSSYSAFTTIGENVTSSGNTETELPSSLGIGLSFKYNGNFLFSLNFLSQNWSTFERNGVIQENLQDLKKYTFGVEYSKELKKFGSFWELVKYRGGLSFEQSQYAINGNGIDQLGIHAGITFPLGISNSIDLGLMYGVRGTTDNNLLKENIIQASVSLNFGELWFVRRER